MKSKLVLLRFFILGFVFAFILHTHTTCKKDDGPVEPQDEQLKQETAEMKNLSDKLITAFKSGDKTQIVNSVNTEYQTLAQNMLNNTPASLSTFGNALEKRKLIHASKLWAEYEVEIGGKKFTVAYANCGDNNWKLVTF